MLSLGKASTRHWAPALLLLGLLALHGPGRLGAVKRS
jgi:hypothetical protein